MAGDSWTFDSLDAFLAKPKDFAPGTKMSFAGLKKPEDRANLILYMRDQSDSPAPLPE
jgi:cytochrome c